MTTVFDGELDANRCVRQPDFQEIRKDKYERISATKKDMSYNEDEVQKSQITVWIVWVNGYDERNGIQNNRFGTCRGLSCGGLLQAVKGR